MKRLCAFALLLAGVALAGCGSSAASTRLSVVQFIRASEAKAQVTHEKFSVRLSKLDPRYAAVSESFTLRSTTLILRRDGSTWRVTSKANSFPICAGAPARVLKELLGSVACYPAVGAYTSFEWTRGHQVTLRYCQRPGGPGNFLAASKGVTCATAAGVIHKLGARCLQVGQCDVASFHCRSYYAGKFGALFANVDHALCTDGGRRVLWDGG